MFGAYRQTEQRNLDKFFFCISFARLNGIIEWSDDTWTNLILHSWWVQVKQCLNFLCKEINLSIFLKKVAHECSNWLQQSKVLRLFVKVWQTVFNLLCEASTVKLHTDLPLCLQLWHEVRKVCQIMVLQLWAQMLHFSFESINCADHIDHCFVPTLSSFNMLVRSVKNAKSSSHWLSFSWLYSACSQEEIRVHTKATRWHCAQDCEVLYRRSRERQWPETGSD